MAHLDGSLAGMADRLGAVAETLSELQIDLATIAADLAHEPGELDALEERIQQLGVLRRKYGDNLEEVLAFGQQVAERAAELDGLLGTADELATELVVAEQTAAQAATKVTAARTKTATQVESRATRISTNSG